jgi:hypothetical protein
MKIKGTQSSLETAVSHSSASWREVSENEFRKCYIQAFIQGVPFKHKLK